MKKKIKFEAALKKLEEIISTLEKDDCDLDKSLEIFEEGVKMSRLCTSQLDEAEKKIEVLLKDENGNQKTIPFEEYNKNQ